MTPALRNIVLMSAVVLIWGSTWIGIRYQLGVVEPLVSIAHRFGLAAVLMFIWLLLRGQLRLPPAGQLGFVLLQGLLLFCINYLFIYQGSATLTTGLVAVVFSTMVVLNPLLATLFLGTPLSARVLAGGVIGLVGMAVVFAPEVQSLTLADASLLAILACLIGTFSASLGNIVASRNLLAGVPVLLGNAWGMAFGASLLYGAALLLGVPITLDWQPLYLGSLLYLAVFGSVIAFWAYVTLLGNIGPERAAYTALLYPLVALAISTVLEDYRWSVSAVAGVLLVLGGNWLVMRRSAVKPQSGSS